VDISRGEFGFSVKDLDAEVKFFELLGFRTSPNQTNNPGPHRIMTDGSIFIGLYQMEFPSPTVGVYCDEIQVDIDGLRTAGIEVEVFTDSNGEIEAAVAVSPYGAPLFLQSSEVFQHPDRVPPFSKVGIVGELALPVSDFESEVTFWQQVGFQLVGGPYDQPEKWGILGDRTLPVGVHETTNYDQPALTFFSPHQTDLIEELHRAGWVFEWSTKGESGKFENAAVITPNGFLIFLFTGDLSDF